MVSWVQETMQIRRDATMALHFMAFIAIIAGAGAAAFLAFFIAFMAFGMVKIGKRKVLQRF